MKLLLLILALVVFLLAGLLCLIGSSWDTFRHLFALAALGWALFAASFLPIP